MEQIVQQCRDALPSFYGSRLAGLVLYGSRSRGDGDDDSDIDLLVLFKEPFDCFEELRRIAGLLYPVQLESERFISAKPAAVADFEAGTLQLYRDAREEGAAVRWRRTGSGGVAGTGGPGQSLKQGRLPPRRAPTRPLWHCWRGANPRRLLTRGPVPRMARYHSPNPTRRTSSQGSPVHDVASGLSVHNPRRAGIHPALAPGSADMPDRATFHVPRTQRQLFLDDGGIERMEKLKRTLHQPEKKGAVIRADHLANPGHTVQTRTAPVWDPDRKIYRFWISGVAENTGYMESPDGLSWRAGRRMNRHITMAVRDPADPDPARRYKAPLLNTGFAVSPDGIRWNKLDLPAIPSSDEGNFSYDETGGQFIHTVKRAGPHGRSLALATSRDFENWTDHGLIFHADDRDQVLGRRRIRARLADPALKQTEYDVPEFYSVQIYNMGVFRYEGLFIGLPSMYHHTGKVPPDWPGFRKMNLSAYIRDLVGKHGDYTGFYTVELVCSRTMEAGGWTRVAERRPFIETSPLGAGAYDLQTIIGPSGAVVRGDELWFYYTGIKQYAFISSGGEPGYDDYFPDAGAICLAVLRRDGFVSLDAGRREGAVLTRPFAASGGRLFVNVAGKLNGELRVEALGPRGGVLAVSAPVTGDRVRAEVGWQRGAFAGLKGKVIRLRFALRHASFYSYWTE